MDALTELPLTNASDLAYDQLTNPFLQAYLAYVKQTEPPRLFHIWSALTCVGASLARHAFTDIGIGRVFGNMYVLLVGPPGTRKSTAVRLPSNIMERTTNVRIAPDDTGGQRQGLIAALLDTEMATDDLLDLARTMAIGEAQQQKDALAGLHMQCSGIDKHAMFVRSSEFGSFLGSNPADLTRFLIKMWDGERYDYKLRAHRYTIEDSAMTILGATTTADIAQLFPPQLIGQGFMSRCIFVYAPRKEREIPPSKTRLAAEYETAIAEAFQYACEKAHGEMQYTPEALELMDRMYYYALPLQDTRFIYYAERRPTHLQKLSMCLAAARQSMQIDVADICEAHAILIATEARMPDALGEYGLSPVAVARQKLVEFLRHAKDPVSEKVLWAVMQRDMKLMDFKNCVSSLVNAERVVALTTPRGTAFMYKDTVARTVATFNDAELEVLLATTDTPAPASAVSSLTPRTLTKAALQFLAQSENYDNDNDNSNE